MTPPERIIFAVTIGIALAVTAIDYSGLAVANPSRNSRVIWEYRVMRLTTDFSADLQEMNSLGSQGWELVETGINRAIFKRVGN